MTNQEQYELICEKAKKYDRLVDVLDKIRAEIEKLSPYNKFTGASYPAYEFKSDVLQIIDKYKAERSE